MFGRVVGYVVVKQHLAPGDANYPFGPKSDIEGKRLLVLERNPDGDCLCLVNDGAGMADIMVRGIERFER